MNITNDEASAKNAEVLRFVNTIDTEASAKTAWVNVFMETQELPANDAKIPDRGRIILIVSDELERIANATEGIEIALAVIGESLGKLLDFISVVSFEDLEQQVEDLSEESKRA